ncbi:hypothetical protein [Streptomyces sp. NBC_01207]|uniref:hypothetical protein n=1 Tax=Streptomyces sp. NBC_01207 TaxID=2903772 RepID=UPI002E0DCE6B|nr:hypothetical protein OG457_27245 [Streptomyces sp. NBC_01207]
MTIPQVPALLEAAGLKKVTEQRLRQLSKEPGWPKPVVDAGPRMRVYDWPSILAFMKGRTLRQGYRTDIHGPADDRKPDADTDDAQPE